MVTLTTPAFQRPLHLNAEAVPRRNILLLGLEPILQSTRAKILEQAGFECFLACELPVPSTMSGVTFRVVILCQTLGPEKACEVYDALRRTSPATAVLRLSKRTSALESCFDHRLFCPTPAELIAAVQDLSRVSRASC